MATVLTDYLLTRYSISEDGKIYDNASSRYMAQFMSDDGYKKCTLRSSNESRKTFYVHRLVALIYIDNPQNKETVNHKNGIKTDNHVSNLEWNTRSEQTQHAWDNKLIQNMDLRKKNIREKQGKKVVCNETGEIFNSVGEAAEKYSLKKTNISAVCNNKVGFKSAGKLNGKPLTWRFA